MTPIATFFTRNRRLPAVAVLLFGLLALSACQSAEPNVGVTVAEVEQDPEAFFGQTVTVSGEDNDIYGPNAFTIGGEGFAGALLIIVPADAEIQGVNVLDVQEWDNDDIVQVTGTVREYIIAEIENEFGIDLVPEIEYEEMEPAVVADVLYVSPRTGPIGGAYDADLAEEEELEEGPIEEEPIE